MKLSSKQAILCLMAVLCFTTFSWGQGTDLGTIRGTVTDATGAAIAGAAITVTDTLTGSSRQAVSNGRGEWQIFGESASTYTVSVTANGMVPKRVTGVVVNGSATASADTRLAAGTSQNVDVTANVGATINTVDQTISQTIDSKAIIELPRDTRDVFSFLYLNPNVTQADVNGNFKFLGSQSYGASFSVDGQRSNGGLFGQPTNSKPSLEAVGDLNILTNNFTAEYAGVANVRVTTKRGGDQYHGSIFYNNSNSALAAWTVQDKNGKANFAPTVLAPKYPTPYFNYNDLGASIGGRLKPIKNTFFFMAYERNFATSPVQLSSTTLPHPSLWAGDFSAVTNKPDVPTNIVLTGTEIANDTVGGLGQQFIRIPARLLNPSTQALINQYFPHLGTTVPINAANGRVGVNFQTNLPAPSTTDRGTLRLDHDFNESNHVYGVYTVSNQSDLIQSALVNPYPGFGLPISESRNHTLSVSYTHTFTPSLINEARGGFNKQHLYTHSKQTLGAFLTGIGFSSTDAATYGSVVGPQELNTFGHMGISFNNNFATIGVGGRNTDRPQDQNLFTFGDTLTWVVGKHNFRFGGDVIRNQFVDGFAVNRGNVRGLLTYKGPGTFAPAASFNSPTDPFANFLLGEPASTFAYTTLPRPPMDAHNWEQGYFIQDSWKVTQNITLNIGLRYDYFTNFVEKNDLLVNFIPNITSSTGNKGAFVIASDKVLPYLDPRIPAYGMVRANQVGLGRGLIHADRTDFAPRLGIAWKINDRNVLRGGYGIFYPTSAAQGVRDPIGTNPFNQGVTKTDRTGSPAVITPLQPWPGFAGTGGGGNPALGGTTSNLALNQLGTNLVDTNLKEPLIQQYTATFEHQVGTSLALRASYIGSYMHGLIAGTDLNEIPANNTPFGTTTGDGVTPCDVEDGTCDLSAADLARRPYPNLQDFLYNYHNYASGFSNAFQIQAEKQYKHGFEFSIAYTYLDQKSSSMDTGNSSLGGAAYNIFDPNGDRGTDAFTSHHRLVGYGVFDVPYGRGKKFGSDMPKILDLVAGGWQGTFNVFAKSGTFFAPYWLCDDCGPVANGNVGSGAVDAVGDFVGTSYRATILDSKFNQGSHGFAFNPSSFGLPSLGADVFSNPQGAKRSSIEGPGAWGLNLGVHKDFHIYERLSLQVGADVDNLFNHPLFTPDSNNADDFALVGDYSLQLNPTTHAIEYDPGSIAPNPTFGALNTSNQQEGVNNRRSIRLRARLTF